MYDKNHYRSLVAEKLSALDLFARQARSYAMVGKVLKLPEFVSAETVMTYLPLSDEVDPNLILAVAGKQCCVPARGDMVDKCIQEKIQPVEFNRWEECRLNEWGVLEPVNLRTVDPKGIDLILVPGRAFTLSGKRIGRGGGRYDQFLLNLTSRCYKIGLAFAEQIFDDLPQREGDVVLDLVVIG